MIEYPTLPSGEKPVWNGLYFQIENNLARVLAYSTNFAGWDDHLTDLHELEAGNGQHSIDILSRRSTIKTLQKYNFPSTGALLEIGCSSGFLLRDLKIAYPQAVIVGADIIVKPLERLGEVLAGVPLIQMDVLQCPFKAGQFDAVVALNVLEHIEDDQDALKQMARLLKPGGLLILEVPQGPKLYDYYDAYLRHFRRYSKQELSLKLVKSNLKIQEINSLGFILYLPFLMLKKMNRLRFGTRGEKLKNMETMVRKQIKTTITSKLLNYMFFIEAFLMKKGTFPLGIRCLAVSKRD